MKYTLLVLVILITACGEEQPEIDLNEENWSKRAVDIDGRDSLIYGKSYLSVYSQMYSFTQNQK